MWTALKTAVSVLLSGRPPQPKGVETSAHYRITNPYHAVCVVPGPGACAAAKSLRGVRFLSREAPAIPVPRCSQESCQCAYKHFDDRRSRARRTADRAGQPRTSWSGAERRHAYGRRSTDLP